MEHDICRERLEAIRNHPLYQSSLRRLSDLERSRIFCRHGMEHLLDTARIAYIKSLERALPLSRDLIYAAALLHDIGKWEQYENGTPHELSSARIAEEGQHMVLTGGIKGNVLFQHHFRIVGMKHFG